MREVSRNEFVEMARRCSNEIKDLRSQIARLQPKADAYEKLSMVLNLLPQVSQGYGEDVAWMLDKRIREIEEAAAAEKGGPGKPAEG